jgi:hypothetical protein
MQQPLLLELAIMPDVDEDADQVSSLAATLSRK